MTLIRCLFLLLVAEVATNAGRAQSYSFGNIQFNGGLRFEKQLVQVIEDDAVCWRIIMAHREIGDIYDRGVTQWEIFGAHTFLTHEGKDWLWLCFNGELVRFKGSQNDDVLWSGDWSLDKGSGVQTVKNTSGVSYIFIDSVLKEIAINGTRVASVRTNGSLVEEISSTKSGNVLLKILREHGMITEIRCSGDSLAMIYNAKGQITTITKNRGDLLRVEYVDSIAHRIRWGNNCELVLGWGNNPLYLRREKFGIPLVVMTDSQYDYSKHIYSYGIEYRIVQRDGGLESWFVYNPKTGRVFGGKGVPNHQ